MVGKFTRHNIGLDIAFPSYHHLRIRFQFALTEKIMTFPRLFAATAAMMLALLGCGKSELPPPAPGSNPVTSAPNLPGKYPVTQCESRGGELCHNFCDKQDCYLFCKDKKNSNAIFFLNQQCRIGQGSDACPNPC